MAFVLLSSQGPTKLFFSLYIIILPRVRRLHCFSLFGCKTKKYLGGWHKVGVRLLYYIILPSVHYHPPEDAKAALLRPFWLQNQTTEPQTRASQL